MAIDMKQNSKKRRKKKKQKIDVWCASISFLREHRGALSAGKGRGEGATLDPSILAFQ